MWITHSSYPNRIRAERALNEMRVPGWRYRVRRIDGRFAVQIEDAHITRNPTV